MYAQLAFFNPRTPAQVAADDFASTHRIVPLFDQFVTRGYLMRRDDGSQVAIMFAETEQALLDLQKAIMNSELLPGEDPALLPGPDRVEIYPVMSVYPQGE
nr:hypothetical protein [uncultured bacterium]